MMGIGMAARAPRTRGLGQMAMDAIRRNGGTLLLPGLPRNWLDSAGTIAATVDNPVGLVQVSVGSNNATQQTTASKPILRRTDGRYAWQFDGSNDFLQTGITTGNEGWVCAGVTCNVSGVGHHIFGNGASAAADVGVWFRANGANDAVTLLVSNGTTREIASRTTAAITGQPKVVDGGWTASTMFAAIDGAETSIAKTVNCTTTKVCPVGGNPAMGWYLNGPMSATVYCPTLPSAADRALIRRFVGSLQGQTL